MPHHAILHIMTSLDLTQYRALVEHSPMMVWRAGLDAKCDYFNPTWLAFTGRSLEQEVGDGWAEGVHPEDRERCLTVYLESFAARRTFEMEYRLRRYDGVFRYLFDRGVPYTDAEADQPHVLRRFSRAANATPENFPGVGLGLALARQILEAHGGALSLRSKVDEVTTVTVNLPLRAEGARS